MKTIKKLRNAKNLWRTDGTPKYVSCWMTKRDPTGDCYTVLYTRIFNGCWNGVGMSEYPTWPTGFGQHFDYDRTRTPKLHIGSRIKFSELPPDCQKLVVRDYCELWSTGEQLPLL